MLCKESLCYQICLDTVAYWTFLTSVKLHTIHSWFCRVNLWNKTILGMIQIDILPISRLHWRHPVVYLWRWCQSSLSVWLAISWCLIGNNIHPVFSSLNYFLFYVKNCHRLSKINLNPQNLWRVRVSTHTLHFFAFFYLFNYTTLPSIDIHFKETETVGHKIIGLLIFVFICKPLSSHSRVVWLR